MKTEVVMKREIFNNEVRQRHKTGFLSGTDLVNAGNYIRMQEGKGIFNLSGWMKSVGTVEFANEIEKKFKVKPFITGKGRKSNTWLHPLLFIDLALAISPSFKLETLQWLRDNLLEYRDKSGDSYKKMSGAIYLRIGDKSKAKDLIKDAAHRIKEKCGVKEWESCSQEVLEKRNKLHEDISLLCDVIPVEKAVDVALAKEK